MQGHTDTVEDVVFQPGSAAELASVADDTKLLFWDTRSGSSPVVQLNQAHGQSDLHVVDWSSLRSELVATGDILLHVHIGSFYQWQQHRSQAVWCGSKGTGQVGLLSRTGTLSLLYT